MNLKLKLGAYAVLLCLTAWFGYRLYASYAGAGHSEAPKIAHHSPKKKKTETNAPPAVAADTNSANSDTNSVAVTTNATDQATNAAATNAMAQAAPDTNQTAAAAAAAADQDPMTMAQTITSPHQSVSVANLGLFVLCAVGLGLLVTFDLTHMVGGKAGDYLYHDVGDAARDPDYEKAEAVWANGKHLEAIQMLRDYYKRNPRQVHAALRIAEIYEKDLRNYLAAALEYEEVLKKKLPSDRWGRAAIHLCNLYSRLGQQDKTVALLQRIAEEHPTCAAAKKAREKLGLPEPMDTSTSAPVPVALAETDEETPYDVNEDGDESAEPSPAAPARAEEPKSNLPPGFRKKK